MNTQTENTMRGTVLKKLLAVTMLLQTAALSFARYQVNCGRPWYIQRRLPRLFDIA